MYFLHLKYLISQIPLSFKQSRYPKAMLCHWIHWIHWWLGSLTFNHRCCHRARSTGRPDFGGPWVRKFPSLRWTAATFFGRVLDFCYSGGIAWIFSSFSQLRARRVSKYVTCNNLEVESSILQWAISDWLKMLAGHTRPYLNTAALLKK